MRRIQFFFCSVFAISTLSFAMDANAIPTTFTAPPSTALTGSLLLHQMPQKLQLTGWSSLGVMRQASVDPGPIVALILLPMVAGAILTLTSIIGGIVGIVGERGNLGWGILNTTLATGWLVCSVFLFAARSWIGGVLSLIGVLLHGLLGGVNIRIHVMKKRAQDRAFSEVSDTPTNTGLRFQKLTPSGVAFSF